ncbi:arylalkylamine N-acetyltransferase-like 2 [Toxorhynchites rutilus septentrionalis]|uniref:arylalkylamine N-acetyltransferase-like 2 n=1 Tax=Toxorhynchites rutilus septentrionalis TaxID=329112 RepID=UPI00247AAB3F|nr:arylalkylamine N-acetyltransferase-like 2 [Toxorhynchites rutilus septentrionalis]
MFRKLKITREKISSASDFLRKSNLYLLQQEAYEEANKWNQKRGKGILTDTFLSKQSIPRTYSIRLAKTQDETHIMHFIRESFFHEEPLMRSLKITKSVANTVLERHMSELLKHGFSMLAVTNEDRILGVALNKRNCQWDGAKLKEQADMIQCDPLRKLFYIRSIASTESQLHEKLNTLCIFEIAILATAREAKRQGIGYQLTLHSLRLARDLGYEVARMDCTNEFSSKVAERVGMECMWSVAYEHLVDCDKIPVVKPDEPHTHFRVHAARLKDL